MKVYEGMFLFDPALNSDWPAAEAEIQRVLGRAEAKIIGIKNWEERRLAYPIKKQKRGLYALTYFEAPPEKITALERDIQLSEKCIRALFLNRDTMTREQIDAALAAEPPKAVSRYDERPGGPGRGDRPDRFDRGPRPGSRPAPVAVEEADIDAVNDAIDDVLTEDIE